MAWSGLPPMHIIEEKKGRLKKKKTPVFIFFPFFPGASPCWISVKRGFHW